MTGHCKVRALPGSPGASGREQKVMKRVDGCSSGIHAAASQLAGGDFAGEL
jgi:hypothetical protein